MNFERACKLLASADVLEAQETLRDLKASDWPNLKTGSRSQIHRRLHQQAYPFEWSNSGPLSLADAAKKLSGLSVPKGKGKGK